MIDPYRSDSSLRMTPPPAMNCSAPGCEFITPAAIPTYEYVIKALEIHVQTAHAGPSEAQVTKTEKPKRPVLTSNMSESDWVFFQHKWERYKRLSNIDGQVLIDELWACLDSDRGRLAFQDGISETNPDRLLAQIKDLAVTTVHPSLHVVELHEAKQSSDETVKAFSARVRGIAANCQLSKTCTKRGCTESVSFLEETCYHAVLTGILNEELREKILTQAMMGTVSNLPTLLEYAAAEEAAKQKTPPRNVAAVRKSATSRKCPGCNQSPHGPFNRKRPSECKAFGKKCAKCEKMNHFTSVCKSSTNAAVQDAHTSNDEESALPTISGFITAIHSTMLTNPESARPLVSTLRASNKYPVNTLPVSHYIYDEEVEKWIKKPPKSSPTVEMSVTLDRQAYKELGLNLPDLVKKPNAGHARARRGTLDTGAQLTIANEAELTALGIKKNSLFPLAMAVNTVTHSGIDLIGGVFLRFSIYDPKTRQIRTTRQLCYISRSIKGVYLSEEACVALGFVESDLGSTIQSVASNPVTRCTNTGVGQEGTQPCSCPRRHLPPTDVPDLPCEPTKENLPALKKFILERYSASAFNICEQQILPPMDKAPPPPPVICR